MDSVPNYNSTPLPIPLPEIYLRKHTQGARVRSLSSLVMGAVAVLAYLLGIISVWQLAGIGGAIAFLVLMNPPLLWLLRRTASLRAIAILSLMIVFLEVICYTAIIHFVAGIESAYLVGLYFCLIGYLGVAAPRWMPIVVAGWCVVCLGLMVVLEQAGVLPMLPTPTRGPHVGLNLPFNLRLMIVGAVGALLLVMAYISSLTAGMLRKSRDRLRKTNEDLESELARRRQMEKELKASEIKFATAFKSGPAIVTLTSLDEGRFLDVNENFLKALGYKRSEVIGRTSAELSLWTDPGDRQRVLAAVGEGKVRDVEVTIQDKGGGRHHLLWSGSVIEIDGQKALIISSTDITDRKMAEQERDRLIGELQEALDKVQTLRGLIPICSHCKKIRDDEGYWHQVESYVRAHSQAEFSHGLCPDCIRKLYPEYPMLHDADKDNPDR